MLLQADALRDKDVSIHAPHAGRDVCALQRRAGGVRVSIHAHMAQISATSMHTKIGSEKSISEPITHIKITGALYNAVLRLCILLIHFFLNGLHDVGGH